MLSAKGLKGQFLGALLVAALSFISVGQAESPRLWALPDSSEVETAIKLFEGKSLDALFAYLDEVRPSARELVGLSQRELLESAIAIATASGELNRTQLEAYQARFAPVLKLHRRERVLAVVVFPDSAPFVMTHAGALITISTKSVELARSEVGLAGIVAHEVAHEYLASPKLADRLDADSRFEREIELVCDGIAVATLLRLGLDPMSYARALEGQMTTSAESRRLAQSHPTLPARLEMIRRVRAEVTAARLERPSSFSRSPLDRSLKKT